MTSIPHRVEDLEKLFDQCFLEKFSTRLRSGANEPLYLPFDRDRGCAEVQSTRNYFASALHEVSHWCIAGEVRRKEVDYGYWYEPDGRDDATQAFFEQVEVKPQALEWIFSLAAGFRFRLSVDNVAQPELKASQQFVDGVCAQARLYAENVLPARPRAFVEALASHYGGVAGVDCLAFISPEYLR